MTRIFGESNFVSEFLVLNCSKFRWNQFFNFDLRVNHRKWLLTLSNNWRSYTLLVLINYSNSDFFRINFYFSYFSTVVPSNSCVFLSCRPFVVNTFSTGLVGVEVLPSPGLGSWQLEFKSLFFFSV